MTRRITDIELPKTLYKYRDWSNKFHRKLLTRQEIYFPKPSEFNDPFDGNIPIRWDLMTYEQCFEQNLKLINTVHKDKDQRLVREYAKKITDEKTLWHPDKLASERPEQQKKWDSVIGLLSLSSIPDNILMWSHYSNNHTGFVVGLETDSLFNDYDFDYIEPIVYQTQYPTISGVDESTEQFHKKFFSKSDLWSYEMEWRISKNHIEKRIVKFRKETISQLIIGCCSNKEQTNKIVKLGRNNFGAGIQIFKAVKDKYDFGLTLEQIE
ncbi:DUF2971 domain-containing protein [uncultured Draconibacterium sp.]|uniref:DUF2971 domain-containing protein n=1 Tax=uncultured Draconibacterium sp. TaxID=1573823 RepID=UPI003216D907